MCVCARVCAHVCVYACACAHVCVCVRVCMHLERVSKGTEVLHTKHQHMALMQSRVTLRYIGLQRSGYMRPTYGRSS